MAHHWNTCANQLFHRRRDGISALNLDGFDPVHGSGLVETRERTGILIFVSLLEHRVVVLADRGIHARVAEGTWDGVVARIVTGIRAGRAEEGLADGIRACGEILAGRLPGRPDDRNELPNAPRGVET